MSEAKLEIKEKVVGDKTYSNINIKDLQDGEYIIIEKTFAEGKEFENVGKDKKKYKSYSCRGKLGETEVSFWLYSKAHDLFKECGGVGDKVKITATEVKKVNPLTKVKMLVTEFSFDKV